MIAQLLDPGGNPPESSRRQLEYLLGRLNSLFRLKNPKKVQRAELDDSVAVAYLRPA